MNFFTDRLNSLLKKQTVRINIRLLLLCLLVGCGLFILSVTIIQFTLNAKAFGIFYSVQSKNPFSPHVTFPHRILAPLSGNIVNLKGDNFIYLPFIFSIILLSLIFYYSLKKGISKISAFIIALSIITTGVILNTNFWPGITDSITLVIMLLMVINIKKTFLFWTLFALGTLNHEQIVFLLPWFIYIRYLENKSNLKKDLVTGVLIGALYSLTRIYFMVNNYGKLDSGYYQKRIIEDYCYNIIIKFKGFLPAFFYTFGFLWVPFFNYVKTKKTKTLFTRRSLLIYFSCIFAILILANDLSRFLSLFYIAIIISMIHFIKEKKNNYYVLLLLVVFNLFFEYRNVVSINMHYFNNEFIVITWNELLVYASYIFIMIIMSRFISVDIKIKRKNQLLVALFVILTIMIVHKAVKYNGDYFVSLIRDDGTIISSSDSRHNITKAQKKYKRKKKRIEKKVSIENICKQKFVGIPWDDKRNIQFEDTLIIDLKRKIKSRKICLTVDSNDVYSISLLNGPDVIYTNELRNSRKMFGITDYTILLPESIHSKEFNTVMLRSEIGDGRYSIGYLHFVEPVLLQ